MKIENLCINCMREMKEPGGICEFCGFNVETFELPRHHMRPFTILAGKYLIGKAIGEGGFGITYIGMDLELEVRVAIKEYYPQGAAARDNRTNDGTVCSYSENTRTFFEEGREKFINEARTIAKFRGLPEIVGIIEFFRENQTAYIVMEYLDGQTLKQYLKTNGGKIPADELLCMMKSLISSLGKLHAQGLIHRDISPDNIMLMKDGSIKILDFGGARDFISQNGKSMSVLVKHGYAPEEQYRSRGNQGPWTDVYALCATMYRCITGEIPPNALDRLYEDELKPISFFNVDCPKYIEEAILKGLSVRKDGRYQSMEELYDALYKEQNRSEKKHKEKISSIELEHSEYIEHAIDRGLNVYADELCDTLQKEQIAQGLNAYADKLYDTLRKEQGKSEKVHQSSETDTKKKENKRNVNKKNEEKKIIIAAAAAAAIGIAVIAGVGIKMKQPDEKVTAKAVTTPMPSAKDEITVTPTSEPTLTSTSQLTTKHHLENTTGDGTGDYKSGEKVKISTFFTNPYFPVWNMKGLIEDIYSSETTFIMPNHDVSAGCSMFGDRPIEAKKDRLYDKSGNFLIKIDGENYILPILKKEFEQNGWRFDFEDERNIKDYPGYYLVGGSALKDDSCIENIVERIDNENQIEIMCMEFLNVEVELPGGIIKEKSTRKEIEDIYGKPDYEDENVLPLWYYVPGDLAIEFVFYSNNGVATDNDILGGITVSKIPEGYVPPQS